jgi:hypothetical protein
MILADAVFPVFTLGTIIFIIPVLALAAIIALILKKRKAAKWIFISLPMAFLLGILADFIGITYFYKRPERPLPQSQQDSLRYQQQQKQADSLENGKAVR